jgi:hypothetical protein
MTKTATLSLKHVEGEYHFWDIGTREGTGEIQVFRNFLAAIKAGGFAFDGANSPGPIVAHKGSTWFFNTTQDGRAKNHRAELASQ